jgi:hypothetical protein
MQEKGLELMNDKFYTSARKMRKEGETLHALLFLFGCSYQFASLFLFVCLFSMEFVTNFQEL